MALSIHTFSNTSGGTAFFKAIGHPLAVPKMRALIARLAAEGPVAIYDPQGFAQEFSELHDLSCLEIAAVYVQDITRIGGTVLGRRTQPVTDLPAGTARNLLIIAFDSTRALDHIRHLIPAQTGVVSLDEIRLEDGMLTNPKRYLDTLNFATNFAFFRDGKGHHTRLVSSNYWDGYGAAAVSIWCCLFDADGEVLATWQDPLTTGTVVVDSRAVRDRFGLDDFSGQLFVHIVGAAGHEIVKYALDTYGDDPAVLSCTHDANAWPSDRYGGLPAPDDGEHVILWVQNSHPCPIPAGSIGLNRMGEDRIAWLDRSIPGFGSHALDVASLLPDLRWPEQLEIRAGKHFVRPRYEVTTANGRLRIAHPNVEREDLTPNPQIAELGNLLGKAYILPAPILPLDRFRSVALPTPMSTAQSTLPLAAILYDASGQEVMRHRLGCLPRNHATLVEVDALLNGHTGLPSGYGHLEFVYDFAEGGEADGWLHGLFRYADRATGHIAETSFGAHVFNTVLTYRNEPQSYAGPAPGLSTRLFLRLGPAPLDTMCHLIYPASTPWHAVSDTKLMLLDGLGEQIAERHLAIPCSGSVLWHYEEMFDSGERTRAGETASVIIRDTTCRLFGYHGLISNNASFSLDHMFGF